MGESAGGGPAAMLTLLARDRCEHAVAGQVLSYPMLDPRTGVDDAPVHNPSTGEFLWAVRHNRFAWAALGGDPAIDAPWSPYLSPALASDLHALPPAFIAVGALDLRTAGEGTMSARTGCPGPRNRAPVAQVFPEGTWIRMWPGTWCGNRMPRSRPRATSSKAAQPRGTWARRFRTSSPRRRALSSSACARRVLAATS